MFLCFYKAVCIGRYQDLDDKVRIVTDMVIRGWVVGTHWVPRKDESIFVSGFQER